MAAVVVDPRKVFEFEDEQSFYSWLGKHWNKESEIWLKIHKVNSGLASITPKEAIDVVLCWGWIDGIRKGFDDKSFLQRYTPRGKKSVWSQINIDNVKRLTEAGKMRPSGLAHVEAAKEDGRWQKAYRIANNEAPPDLLEAIRAEPKALAMYETLSSQNRFALTFRTMSMKTEAGRKKKIEGFVAMLKKGETIHPNGTGAKRKAEKAPAESSKASKPKAKSAKPSTAPKRKSR
ncbi:putative periplasmic membrane protein [Labilithrix luteola]|uniref:Putative periplasmic membrane protein n=1 Tax=Labilithrix luteola TaxID=1391654 RepID=A0A0K1PQ38_9BACT|nr:YdeI/OmpD-associated family protein [Labilithrix luteola]AKU95501.1 putative periplasmic membrane protein [Labilithrix luteola]